MKFIEKKSLSMFMRSFLFAAIILALMTHSGRSQDSYLSYKVLHNGKDLGSLKAIQSVEEDSVVTYKSHTDIKYDIIATIHVNHKISASFINNNMTSSKVESTIGKRKPNIMTTEFNNGEYAYSKNGREKARIQSKVTLSVQKLFFVEPIGITRVYSEEQGNFHRIKKTGDHQYVKTAPNGRESIYYYENGILIKNEIDAGLVSFEMVLQK